MLDQSDVDQAALAAAQQPPAVEALDPQTEADQARFLVANIGAVLILVGIFSFGFTVLTGVVEEKQSRVVEVVLATVRARDLLMGKVLGIGVLGIVQLIVFVVAAIAAALITDRLTLPTTTPGAVALLGLWFILGYLLYSTALGFLGALASRMEEASNASTPVTMVAMISYFVAIFAVINDPDGTVATIATFFPPSAPFVVPLRAAFDAIPPWQIGLSVAHHPGGDLGAVLDRGAGLCRRRPPARRADQAARRVAVGRGVARSQAVERLEQAGRPAGVPEDDLPAVERPVAGQGDETGQRLGGVDRIDQDPLGPRQQTGRLVGRLGRPAVAVAELAAVEHDLPRRRRRPARRSRRAAPRSPRWPGAAAPAA